MSTEATQLHTPKNQILDFQNFTFMISRVPIPSVGNPCLLSLVDSFQKEPCLPSFFVFPLEYIGIRIAYHHLLQHCLSVHYLAAGLPVNSDLILAISTCPALPIQCVLHGNCLVRIPQNKWDLSFLCPKTCQWPYFPNKGLFKA